MTANLKQDQSKNKLKDLEPRSTGVKGGSGPVSGDLEDFLDLEAGAYTAVNATPDPPVSGRKAGDTR